MTITGIGLVRDLTSRGGNVIVNGANAGVRNVNAYGGKLSLTDSGQISDTLTIRQSLDHFECTGKDRWIYNLDLFVDFTGNVPNNTNVKSRVNGLLLVNDRVASGTPTWYQDLPYAVKDSATAGKYYVSVEDAISKSASGVKLLDHVASVEVEGGKTITIDLNGKTITTLKNYGTLTITDGTYKTGGTVTEANNEGTITVSEDGEVTTLNNKTDGEANVNGGEVTTLDNSGEAEVKGGTVTEANNEGTITVSENGKVTTLNNETDGEAKVNGGEVGTLNNEGNAVITDGTVNTLENSGEAEVKGGEVTEANNEGTLTVSEDGKVTTLNNKTDGTANVIGGEVETLNNGGEAEVKGGTVGTLDNDGKAVITDGTVGTLDNSGEAEVKGGTVTEANNEGTLTVSENGKVTELNNETDGTAKVNGGEVGTLDNDGKAFITDGEVGTLDNSGEAEVKGGTVTEANNEGTLTVSENGKVTTLNNETDGEANVNGGEIETLNNDGDAVIADGEIGTLNNSGEVTITDGSITDVNNSGEGSVTISGGFFGENVGEFVDPESGVVAEKDGTYAVNDSIWQLPGLDDEDAQLNFVHVPEKGLDLELEDLPEDLVIKNDTETTIYINNHIIAGGEEGKLSEFPVRNSDAGYETANGKYFVLKGGNANWTSGSSEGLEFTLNAKNVIKVLIDGVEVAFTITDDGEIEIAAEVLAALEKGEHEVTFVFADGQCSTTITIV